MASNLLAMHSNKDGEKECKIMTCAFSQNKNNLHRVSQASRATNIGGYI